LYETHVLPRVIDRLLDTRQCRALRLRAVEGLSGEVLEVGFGSGLNLPHLPRAVHTLLAVDPAEVGRKLAAQRVRESHVDVQYVGLDGQRLPLSSQRVDAVLSTFTLCTIPDALSALREVRRVLRPGGKLHFLEHGRADEGSVARLQRVLTPIQARLGGGCELARDIPSLLARAGFAVDTLDTFYMKKTPRVFGFMYLGTATPR
jgi:ubiquinone/menaquinone biosynthesis C-methylase UbiE